MHPKGKTKILKILLPPRGSRGEDQWFANLIY